MHHRHYTTVLLVVLIAAVPHVRADERRAPAPTFTPQQLGGIFFDNLDDAFRGPRPTLSSIRKSAQAAVMAAAKVPSVGSGGGDAGQDLWAPLISPASIEDEIKRVRLHFGSIITTSGAFNSGGYQEARLDLTVLAVLFAVIHEHSGEVRWKDQATAARDLLARSAFNCKAGSTQVYNEAKLRKAELQDLVSGSGLSGGAETSENEWPSIADRTPLMEYAEILTSLLEDASRDEPSINKNADEIKRNSELLSVLGEVLIREGMDDADNDDYVQLSRKMMADTKKLTAAIDRKDVGSVVAIVGAIRQRCDACHQDFR